jgi:hypothetical protein
MLQVITYSLRDGQKRSDRYYQVIAAFTDEVIAEARQRVGGLVDEFRTFIQEEEWEDLRTFPEYAFELLTLGVLWRVYLGRALELKETPHWILERLVELRRNSTILKPAADFLRGVFGTLFLITRDGRETQKPSLQNLSRLIDWLDAACDFNEEVKRLRNWEAYFSSLQENKIALYIVYAIEFAKWFEDRSLKALGRFTPNVEQFIQEKQDRYRWREDLIFVGRGRVEYHLNMVGMEVLNRAIREKFLAAERKIVLVPPCMRIKQEGCEAYETPIGEHCNHCEPGCRVHQITRLGEKHGFEVFFLPRQLASISNVKTADHEKIQVGIVGVSCPLTIVTGGWQTRDMGVPAVGLPLDHCGCRWHWHLDGGIQTDVNFKQLLKMLQY